MINRARGYFLSKLLIKNQTGLLFKTCSLILASGLRVVIPKAIFSSIIFSQSILLKNLINSCFSSELIALSQKSLLKPRLQFSKSIFSCKPWLAGLIFTVSIIVFSLVWFISSRPIELVNLAFVLVYF
ncbi:hypothetical protein [uncultured Gammaproteobacteria bacterium]|nr:hypothetical protein [uncultured Gammaproteobacteria bacterium]CAC9624154.1 hypothetical protein [uncultured Gammaproteobacteria bacterium]